MPVDRLVLLHVLGRDDEVDARLASVDTQRADGCAWCTAEDVVVVGRRRSEAAERRGDLQAAPSGVSRCRLCPCRVRCTGSP